MDRNSRQGGQVIRPLTAHTRSVCQKYVLGVWTLYKILTHPEPPGYRVSTECSRPKLGEFLGVIDEIVNGHGDLRSGDHEPRVATSLDLRSKK